MDWDLLRVFLAVARTGRASAAARTLGVDHTTVGRRLAALEAELAVPLFHRTASGYRPTPQGERILADAEAMERAALGIGAGARAGTDEAVGRVRVALLDEYASHWVAPRIPELRKRHPAIELELVIGIRQLDLTRGEADIAIRTPRPRQPGLVATRLWPARIGLYASRALVGRRGLRVTDADSLEGHPLLVFVSEHHALQSAPWFQPILAAAPVAMTTNSTHALLAAARAGAGVAVVPRFVAARYDDLVAVSADTAVGDMWLVTHGEYRRDPRIRATTAFLKEAAVGVEQ